MSLVFRKVGTGISFGQGGRPYLDIFARDENNKRVVVKVPNLPLYFYIKEDEQLEDSDFKDIIGEYHGYHGLFGEKLKKIKVKRIRDIRRLGKNYHGYESDVKWDKKMLLDLKITDMFVSDGSRVCTLDSRFNAMVDTEQDILTDDGLSISTTVTSESDKLLVSKALEDQEALLKQKPKIGNEPFEVRHAIFDIEVIVDSREDLRTFNGKIVCVVIYDSYEKKYHEIRLDTSEKELVKEVLRVFKNIDADIISGWNVEFDMGWVINKAIDYDLDLSVYFPGGKTFISKYTDHEGKLRQQFYIGGRSMLDGMDLYKKKTMTTEKLASYSLKTVAVVEGFPEWEDYGARVKEMWETQADTVVEYCKKDVEATLHIITQKDLLGGALTISKFYGCGFEDVMTNSKVIESMAFLLKKNRILPNIVRGREKAKIKGAKVLKTMAGVHKNVGIYDAKSLYPSIIRGLNVSPECLMVGKDLFEDKTADCVSVDIDGIKHFLIKTDKKMGLMTEVITEMQKMREDIRARRQLAVEAGDDVLFKLLNNEEKVCKGVLASVYGVMGFNGFRLFNQECANIITAVARGTTMGIVEKMDSDEFKVIYGDTDSVFIQTKDIEHALTAQVMINKITFDYVKSMGVSENVIQVSFEKYFRWIMFSKKASVKLKSKIYKRDPGNAQKRYIGYISHVEGAEGKMKETNELYYKGFELRRSDSAKALKIVMKEFFNLMKDGDYKKAVTYLKSVKKEFSTYDKDYIAMPRSVNNEDANGPYPRGLRYSKEVLQFEFADDTMPKLLYVKPNYSMPKTDVICYQDGHVIPESFVIDYDLMFDKLIKAKFEPILESLDMYWDTEINNQQSLDAWA